jgi:hypothetical protein
MVARAGARGHTLANRIRRIVPSRKSGIDRIASATTEIAWSTGTVAVHGLDHGGDDGERQVDQERQGSEQAGIEEPPADDL